MLYVQYTYWYLSDVFFLLLSLFYMSLACFQNTSFFLGLTFEYIFFFANSVTVTEWRNRSGVVVNQVFSRGRIHNNIIA